MLRASCGERAAMYLVEDPDLSGRLLVDPTVIKDRMLYTSESLEAVIEHLSRLPTIGRKTAQRIALYLLKQPREEVVAMAKALVGMKDKVVCCSVCQNITEHDPCPICLSPKRERG